MSLAKAAHVIRELCEAFGLESGMTSRIVLVADAHERLVQLEVTHYIKEEQAQDFVAKVRRFTLVETD